MRQACRALQVPQALPADLQGPLAQRAPQALLELRVLLALLVQQVRLGLLARPERLEGKAPLAQRAPWAAQAPQGQPELRALPELLARRGLRAQRALPALPGQLVQQAHRQSFPALPVPQVLRVPQVPLDLLAQPALRARKAKEFRSSSNMIHSNSWKLR